MRSRIASVRAERDLSQAELARRAGIPLRTLRSIERGEVWNPGIRHLANLALALECPLERICEPVWVRGTDFGAPRKGR